MQHPRLAVPTPVAPQAACAELLVRSHVLHHRDIHTSGAAPCRLEALQLDLKGLGEPGARAVGVPINIAFEGIRSQKTES